MAEVTPAKTILGSCFVMILLEMLDGERAERESHQKFFHIHTATVACEKLFPFPRNNFPNKKLTQKVSPRFSCVQNN